MKKFLATLCLLIVAAGISFAASNEVYVYDVSYNANNINVVLKMSNEAKKQYSNVRVKVSPVGKAANIVNASYKYIDVNSEGTVYVQFECKDNANQQCGAYDFKVETLDKLPKK